MPTYLDPVLVQEVGVFQTNTAAGTHTLTVPAGGCAAGNVVAIRGYCNLGSNTLDEVTVTDSRANTWTTHLRVPTSASGSTLFVATAPIDTALQAGDTITISTKLAGAAALAVLVAGAAEWSNVDTSSTRIEGSTSAVQASASGVFDSGTLTVTTPKAVILGAYGSNNSTAVFTADTPQDWSDDVPVRSNTTPTVRDIYRKYKIATAAASHRLQGTNTTTTANAAAIVALKAASIPDPPSGQATIRGTAAAHSNTAVSTLTIPLPTGAAPGDLCFVHVWCGSSNAGFSPPTGWDQTGLPAEEDSNPTSPNQGSQVIYKRVLQAGDTAPTITWTAGASRAAGETIAIADHNGIDGTMPAQSASLGTPTINVSHPSATPTVTNTLLLVFAGSRGQTDATSPSYTPAPGMTLENQRATNAATGTNVGVAVSSEQRSAIAPTGTRTTTVNISSAWVGATVLVKPTVPVAISAIAAPVGAAYT